MTSTRWSRRWPSWKRWSAHQSPEAAVATLDPFQLVEFCEDGTSTARVAGRRELGELLAYRPYAADPERQAVARAEQQELRRGGVL